MRVRPGARRRGGLSGAMSLVRWGVEFQDDYVNATIHNRTLAKVRQSLILRKAIATIRTPRGVMSSIPETCFAKASEATS